MDRIYRQKDWRWGGMRQGRTGKDSRGGDKPIMHGMKNGRETGPARGKDRHSGCTKEKSIKRAPCECQAGIHPCQPLKKPGNPKNVFVVFFGQENVIQEGYPDILSTKASVEKCVEAGKPEGGRNEARVGTRNSDKKTIEPGWEAMTRPQA